VRNCGTFACLAFCSARRNPTGRPNQPPGTAQVPVETQTIIQPLDGDTATWMQRTFPSNPFERFADDATVHCRSEEQARLVLDAIQARLAECGLELHPTKTKIVYCKDDDRWGTYENIKLDFLGYSFQPRRAKNRWGKFFVSFLPAISAKATKAIPQTIRNWRMARSFLAAQRPGQLLGVQLPLRRRAGNAQK
jgi:hypothetical protein